MCAEDVDLITRQFEGTFRKGEPLKMKSQNEKHVWSVGYCPDFCLFPAVSFLRFFPTEGSIPIPVPVDGVETD